MDSKPPEKSNPTDLDKFESRVSDISNFDEFNGTMASEGIPTYFRQQVGDNPRRGEEFVKWVGNSTQKHLRKRAKKYVSNDFNQLFTEKTRLLLQEYIPQAEIRHEYLRGLLLGFVGELYIKPETVNELLDMVELQFPH